MKQTSGIVFRQWTRKNLTEDDYSFARSKTKNKWECLASQLWDSNRQAARTVVSHILDWELFREFDCNEIRECQRSPFLSVPANYHLIEAVRDPATRPTPETIQPLCEVPLRDGGQPSRSDLAELADYAGIQTRGLRHGALGIEVRAFEISIDEETALTVQRFRNWLVAFKKKPGLRRQSFVGLKKYINSRGRLNYDIALRDLAVRRLKKANYTREEAESALGLALYFLNPKLKPASRRSYNYWNKGPKRAENKIKKLADALHATRSNQ